MRRTREDFPRVARYRKNLTALSCHYNLYFAAYRGYIHVFTPSRNSKKVLGRPLAILNPEHSKTPMSRYTRGHLNPTCPHEINDMLIGNLGDLEILLVARDNGDVAAWYTSAVAREVEVRLGANPDGSPSESPPGGLPSPKHFFADNVGVSAWGLAVHAKSRLIAVSANNKEVTVFAFALDAEDADAQFQNMHSNLNDLENICKMDTKKEKSPSARTQYELCKDLAQAFDEDDGSISHGTMDEKVRTQFRRKSGGLIRLETKFWTRRRTWRIVIPIGMEAANLPSVSFCDDSEGNADRIAAIDINGSLFIADIWSLRSRVARVPVHNVQTPNGVAYGQDVNHSIQGWNVLPVMDSQLLPTNSLREAFGATPAWTVYRGKTSRGAWLDISKSMVDVREDVAVREHQWRFLNYISRDVSTENDGPCRGETTPHARRLPVSDKVTNQAFYDKDDDHLAMTMIPITGDHYAEFPNARSLAEFTSQHSADRRMDDLPRSLKLAELRKKRNNEDSIAHLVRGISFLRANQEDVEMLSLTEPQDGCGVVCHHVLPNINPHGLRAPWDMRFSRRCSMLLTIPELSLVVLGSMSGRVALLTLTRPPRPPDGHYQGHPRRAFRVDAVLPFQREEELKQRPYVCLLGIAVSPVPEAGASGLALRRARLSAYGGRRAGAQVPPVEPDPPERWRLLLHYMNHDILQYEISRRGVDRDVPESATPWEKRAWGKEWGVSRAGPSAGSQYREEKHDAENEDEGDSDGEEEEDDDHDSDGAGSTEEDVETEEDESAEQQGGNEDVSTAST